MKKIIFIAIIILAFIACEKKDVQPTSRTVAPLTIVNAKWFSAPSTGSMFNIRYTYQNNDSANIKRVRMTLGNGQFFDFLPQDFNSGRNTKILFMFACQYCALEMKLSVLKKDNTTFESNWVTIEK